MAPTTLSVKWYFSNVKGRDVQFTISQKRLKSIRRDAKGHGRGQRWAFQQNTLIVQRSNIDQEGAGSRCMSQAIHTKR